VWKADLQFNETLTASFIEANIVREVRQEVHYRSCNRGQVCVGWELWEEWSLANSQTADKLV